VKTRSYHQKREAAHEAATCGVRSLANLMRFVSLCHLGAQLPTGRLQLHLANDAGGRNQTPIAAGAPSEETANFLTRRKSPKLLHKYQVGDDFLPQWK
jgi:hypothetical protein